VPGGGPGGGPSEAMRCTRRIDSARSASPTGSFTSSTNSACKGGAAAQRGAMRVRSVRGRGEMRVRFVPSDLYRPICTVRFVPSDLYGGAEVGAPGAG
jgi:hypothetical protein